MTTAGTTPAPEQSAVSARATTEESAFISRVDVLAEGIKSGIKSGQGEPAQHELARLAVILRDLYDGTNLAAIARAEIVAKALFQDEPDLVLARENPFGVVPAEDEVCVLGAHPRVGLRAGFIFRDQHYDQRGTFPEGHVLGEHHRTLEFHALLGPAADET